MNEATQSGLPRKVYPTALQAQFDALEQDEAILRFRESRESLAADPYRPLYHFSPPEGRMSDPNGLCHWQGRYHLCYQFWPVGQEREHWGHTVSDDLAHWRDLPVAISPEKEGSCYSGQSLVEANRVIAIYHGTGAGNCIATASDPLLLNWQKHPANPVIPIVPIDEKGLPYRVFDPCIWKEEDGYYALSGVFKDGRNVFDCRLVEPLFRSKDLATWEYLGPMIEDGFYTEIGEDGAVPNFWPIGNGRHMMLFFSHKRAAQYYIGFYDRKTHRFVPETHGRMNYGPVAIGSLHAPSATVDEAGRFLAIFNIKDAKPTRGWTNIMSLPRHLSLNADNSLRIEPVPELQGLRLERRRCEPVEIPANGEAVLPAIRGKAMEIEALIDPGAAREIGLCVLRSPDGAEKTAISLLRDTYYRIKNMHSLSLDVSVASLAADVRARPPEIGPLLLDREERLHLRVFVDRSVVEVFANGRQCLTVRAYPEREDSCGVSLFAREGAARLLSLDAWHMRSIWPELTRLEGR